MWAQVKPNGNRFTYSVLSSTGKSVMQGQIENPAGSRSLSINLQQYETGIYLIVLQNEDGQVFRVKVVKG
ncbi:MAG: hypothetical protein B6D64_02255 [Bacteroidetes bacterium 4484_276]|nr:MAG: hypothetical protein B6D64_02255 [Bacteroidetes bacterium 4484_276]OYT14116.1 MAG: hypothetical protein B6I19_01595 [Bacteroidetes bacterium 4572_114]